jgi:hypothetical protein
VSQGAVLKGAGIGAMKPVSISLLGASYGFICGHSAVEGISGKSAIIHGRVSWLLHKGDLVPGRDRNKDGVPIDEIVSFDSIVDVSCDQRDIPRSRACVRFVVSRQDKLPTLAGEVEGIAGK